MEAVHQIRGTVTQVRYATEITDNGNGTSTSFVATLQVGSTPIRLQMPAAIVISEGDEVLVAGPNDHGVLNAFAYRNFTNGAVGRGAISAQKFQGWIFVVVGLATAIVGIGLVFLYFGVKALKNAAVLSDAYSIVSNV